MNTAAMLPPELWRGFQPALCCGKATSRDPPLPVGSALSRGSGVLALLELLLLLPRSPALTGPWAADPDLNPVPGLLAPFPSLTSGLPHHQGPATDHWAVSDPGHCHHGLWLPRLPCSQLGLWDGPWLLGPSLPPPHAGEPCPQKPLSTYLCISGRNYSGTD